MEPLTLILWALAVLVAAFVLFFVVTIIKATVRAIRKPKTDPTILDARRGRS